MVDGVAIENPVRVCWRLVSTLPCDSESPSETYNNRCRLGMGEKISKDDKRKGLEEENRLPCCIGKRTSGSTHPLKRSDSQTMPHGEIAGVR
jgi:hypothetical protein